MTGREWIVNRENKKSVFKTTNLLSLNVVAQTLIMLGLAFLGIFVITVVFGVTGNIKLFDKADLTNFNNPLGLVLNIFSYIPALLLPPVFYILLRKRPIKELISFKAPKISDVFVSFFGVMAFAFVGMMVSVVVALILRIFGLQPADVPFNAPDGVPLGILYVLMLAVLPAFLEEFAYRGVIMGEMRRYNGWAAIILSSLLFSLMHATVAQIPYALFVGFAIAYFVIKFNSFWIGVVIHFINNGIAAVESYLLKFYPDKEMYLNMGFTLFQVVLFIIGISILIPFFVMKGIKIPKKEGEIGFGLSMKGILSSPVFYSVIVLLLLITLLSVEKIK